MDHSCKIVTKHPLSENHLTQNSSMLDISPLKDTEYEAWQPLAQAYLAFYRSTRPPEDYHLLWQRLMAKEPLHSLGARLNGQLVGLAHYLFHASAWGADVCYLQDLYVDPAHRRQGVARCLIEGVSHHARWVHAPRVYWLTQAGNTVARQLYDQVATHSGFIRYEMNL